jgi:hypothetical protein
MRQKGYVLKDIFKDIIINVIEWEKRDGKISI